jgi:hypothetical protein
VKSRGESSERPARIGRVHWHVALTHFPISLIGTAFLFQVLAHAGDWELDGETTCEDGVYVKRLKRVCTRCGEPGHDADVWIGWV